MVNVSINRQAYLRAFFALDTIGGESRNEFVKTPDCLSRCHWQQPRFRRLKLKIGWKGKVPRVCGALLKLESVEPSDAYYFHLWFESFDLPRRHGWAKSNDCVPDVDRWTDDECDSESLHRNRSRHTEGWKHKDEGRGRSRTVDFINLHLASNLIP